MCAGGLGKQTGVCVADRDQHLGDARGLAANLPMGPFSGVAELVHLAEHGDSTSR